MVKKCCARDTNEDGNCDRHPAHLHGAACNCWRCHEQRSDDDRRRRRDEDSRVHADLLAQTSAASFDSSAFETAAAPDPAPSSSDFGGGDYGGGGASGSWGND